MDLHEYNLPHTSSRDVSVFFLNPQVISCKWKLLYTQVRLGTWL